MGDLTLRLCVGIVVAGITGCTRVDTRPNIVFILIDDIGIEATNSYGSEGLVLQNGDVVPYQQPSLDAMAAAGMTFRNAYATPACAPTRGEFLTGRYPFVIPKDSIAEAARVIQEERPTRLSLLDRDLRGDIETIILKTLEKDPSRRYQSAAELAADLRRYLSEEPIHARPVSSLYRFHMFARRNRALVGTIAGVILALSLGLAASLRAFHLTAERLEVFRRLADTQDLDKYRAEAELLWPADPQNIIAMRAWIQPVRGRLHASGVLR